MRNVGAARGQYEMKRDQSGPFLSAVFVDYDNIYLSLRRKSEEAAKRFAKDAMGWLRQIESGALITPTNALAVPGRRRIVMNRCYGNPVPRRNTSDNSTDMSSFPFVRHHFLRAGFEVVDCPPLTAQLKNSSDIRMVMDLRDYLGHETYFDEFVILSGDADFTPVLHRLRAHARRTVIYATEYTAAPYTAISDGEVREADLIAMLIEGRTADQAPAEAPPTIQASIPTPVVSLEATRRAIIEEVAAAVRSAIAPVPLEVLADRAVRSIGHDRTIGTGWAGAGGFRELLAQGLPQGLRLSGEPPYVVIDTQRHIVQAPSAPRLQAQPAPIEVAEPRLERTPIPARDIAHRDPAIRHEQPQREIVAREEAPEPHHQYGSISPVRHQDTHAAPISAASLAPAPGNMIARRPAAEPAMPISSPQQKAEAQGHAQPGPNIQQSIARIHEACKAPPLAPPEYRLLFELIAQEITENGLIGAQTIQNIALRAQERGIDVRRDDVRFVLEVVSEADPWFEQGASANLFAGRFRNFVVARCRAQGLTLSADELDLIEAWFAGSGLPTAVVRQPPATPSATFAAPPARTAAPPVEANYWPGHDEPRPQQVSMEARPRQTMATAEAGDLTGDDFPRIVRTRLRG